MTVRSFLFDFIRSAQRTSRATGGLAVGAITFALGASANGPLLIRGMDVSRARFDSMKIGDLEADTLRVRRLEVISHNRVRGHF